MATSLKIGIIGGTGLYRTDVIENAVETFVDTPYGKPSDALILGQIGGVDCVLLFRHGRSHSTLASFVNYRANLWALKSTGCTHLIVSTACGSLKPHIKPGDFVMLDSFIDRTTKRQSTFYDGTEGGLKGVCYMPMAEPFCVNTRQVLISCCRELGFVLHETGTCVTIEGPRFSSKAESRVFQSWGADVVNMTTLPEVALANELGLCYAAVALVTDYDCWKDDEVSVNHVEVLKVMKTNSENVINLFKKAIPKIADSDYKTAIETRRNLASSSVV